MLLSPAVAGCLVAARASCQVRGRARIDGALVGAGIKAHHTGNVEARANHAIIGILAVRPGAISAVVT